MSERSFRTLIGATAVLFFVSAVVLGAKISNGLLRPKYQIEATFAAAGQGLIDTSDVKIHGVNIGRVKKVTLERGRARVRMDIQKDEKIPVGSKATIRPKTLFGEKFVDIDPGTDETSGPFLQDEGEIRDTLGGFELEKVLTDLYPILEVIEPEQLATVVSTLAEGGEGLGDEVNRTIVNFERVARVQAEHAADTQQFLDDFALLSEELARRANDIVAGARDLNAALPTLNARGDELATFLDQGARLARDVADVLEANKPFLQKSVTEGGKTIQLLYDKRGQIAPLVVGLRQFLQTLAEVARIPFGDTGTNLAAIKLTGLPGDPCFQGRGFFPCEAEDPPASATAAAQPAGVPALPLQHAPTPTPPTRGSTAVVDLIKRLAS